MGEMTIRINDENLIKRLELLADAHNRSPESEALVLLDQALKASPKREDFVAIAKAIAAMTPKGVKQTDSVLLLRESRGE